jgi:hypothetical protein
LRALDADDNRLCRPHAPRHLRLKSDPPLRAPG